MRLVLLCLVLPLLAGCISKRTFESEPVTVSTAAGPVTCQLYGRNQVVWDEALLKPPAMTDAGADRICRDEGYRRKP